MRYFCTYAVTCVLAASTCFARDVYVSTDGKRDGGGTRESPWDLASTLAGEQAVGPGDTVYILEGTYRNPQRGQEGGYKIKLAGSKDKPIHVRPLPGARVRINDHVEVVEPAAHLWVWDIEIALTEVEALSAEQRRYDSNPKKSGMHTGGLTISSGSNCKYINLVIHDNLASGVGFWKGAINSELYGCLIYDNGWIGDDRYHGPGIYTQNRDGEKRISDCMIFANYSTTIQAYGSNQAWVDHFRIINNIAFDPVKEGKRQRILVGGGRPSRDILVKGNICHEVPIQIGYGKAGPEGTDIAVTENVVIGSSIKIASTTSVTKEGNFILNEGDERPSGPMVYLRPNKYAKNRANLAIVNLTKQKQVPVDVKGFLEDGSKWRLMNPYDFFGKPVASGVFKGESINVTIEGEFAAYVLLADAADVSPQR